MERGIILQYNMANQTMFNSDTAQSTTKEGQLKAYEPIGFEWDAHPFSKKDAWFNESLTMPREVNEDDFFASLSQADWDLLSSRRRNEFADARNWVNWCRRIEQQRMMPVSPPSKKENRIHTPFVVEDPKIKLRRDYLEDPAKYFANTREQRSAIALIESEIVKQMGMWQLNAELLMEREEAKMTVAAEKIQAAWRALCETTKKLDEMEYMWDRFERMCIDMD